MNVIIRQVKLEFNEGITRLMINIAQVKEIDKETIELNVATAIQPYLAYKGTIDHKKLAITEFIMVIIGLFFKEQLAYQEKVLIFPI